MTDTQANPVLDVQLRDIQTLLRRKFNDDDLVVVKYESEPLLPPGENYGSTMLKVNAVIKKNVQAKEEDLHLVAKMLPATEFQRKIFDSPYTFRKEAFLYEELIPFYQRLQSEFGVPKEEIFDNVPELFGVRWSLKSNEDFDDDAVILMQNLGVFGYYTGSRKYGLDLEHANVAVSALARFHALGIATRLHRPEYFEIFKVRAKSLEFKPDEHFVDIQSFYKRTVREDPEMSVYFDRLDPLMSQEVSDVWMTPTPETWSSIIHSDFWVNNFMFRKDPNTNRVIDIKFVDFQNYLNLSPLRELIFFLVVSLNTYTMENHFDEILDSYYEYFINALERLKCDTEPYRRDKFDERLKIDAFHEFPHCPFMLRILSADVEQSDVSADQVENFMMGQSATPLFIERLRRCVKKYAEKGWLDE